MMADNPPTPSPLDAEENVVVEEDNRGVPLTLEEEARLLVNEWAVLSDERGRASICLRELLVKIAETAAENVRLSEALERMTENLRSAEKTLAPLRKSLKHSNAERDTLKASNEALLAALKDLETAATVANPQRTFRSGEKADASRLLNAALRNTRAALAKHEES